MGCDRYLTRALAAVGLLALVAVGNGCATQALWEGHGRRYPIPYRLIHARLLAVDADGEVVDRAATGGREVLAVRFIAGDGETYDRAFYTDDPNPLTAFTGVDVSFDAPAEHDALRIELIKPRRGSGRFRDPHFVVRSGSRPRPTIVPPLFWEPPSTRDTIVRVLATPVALAFDGAIGLPLAAAFLPIGVPYLLIWGVRC